MYADMPGLVDTKGLFADCINSFMSKLVFNKAESIIFIVPITQEQILDARGMKVMEHIQVI